MEVGNYHYHYKNKRKRWFSQSYYYTKQNSYQEHSVFQWIFLVLAESACHHKENRNVLPPLSPWRTPPEIPSENHHYPAKKTLWKELRSKETGTANCVMVTSIPSRMSCVHYQPYRVPHTFTHCTKSKSSKLHYGLVQYVKPDSSAYYHYGFCMPVI